MTRRAARFAERQRDLERLVQRLIGDFEAFRSQNPPRTRVPQALRRAALEAIEAGADPAAVRRVCGVSQRQVSRWQQELPPVTRQRPSAGGRVVPRPPKVLSVVETPVPGARPPGHDPRAPRVVASAAGEEIDLDVRLGPWRLVLRLTPAKEL